MLTSSLSLSLSLSHTHTHKHTRARARTHTHTHTHTPSAEVSEGRFDDGDGSCRRPASCTSKANKVVLVKQVNTFIWPKSVRVASKTVPKLPPPSHLPMAKSRHGLSSRSALSAYLRTHETYALKEAVACRFAQL